MECTPNNWKDVQRYFHNTYVKVEEYGDTLFYIEGVSPNKIFGKTENGDYFEIELHQHQPFNLSYVLPHKAVFQYNKRAVLLQRIPAKQFKRGISIDNVSISFTDTGAYLDLTLDLLKAYTTKQRYFTFTDAFLTKGSKLLSYALTSRMSCTKGTGVIYVDNTPVARYAHNDVKIYVDKPNFRPDIEQLVAKNQDKIGVV